MRMNHKEKTIIGIVELVSLGKRAVDVPAKIDTGADSSAIWASNIRVGRDGVLRFSLFGEGSPYFSGKIFKRTDFSVAQVKSSNGQTEIRYRTHFSVTIAGKKIKGLFNLSDRSRNAYKILIGRRTISRKFLVDVSRGAEKMTGGVETKRLERKLQKDPYQFHKKYVKKKKVTP